MSTPGTAVDFGSYPTAVSIDDEGILWVPMEGSDVVLSIDPTPLPFESTWDFPSLEATAQSFSEVNGGPYQVTFVGDNPIVFNSLDRTIYTISAASHELSRQETGDMFMWMELNFIDFIGVIPELLWLEGDIREGSIQRIINSSTLTLDPDLETGRRLFYAANDDTMSQDGVGVSCSTCHFEGRNDGLSWELDGMARQTPSLAGNVGETAPYTWLSNVWSVADEAMITAETRMGGHLHEGDAIQIERFVNALRSIVPAVSPEDQRAIRGAEAFMKAGCQGCHFGEHYTAPIAYNVIDDVWANTPSLMGIGSTAPYFHDGSAQTLRDVIVFSQHGAMGNTSILTEAEKSDLEMFLRSL